MNQAEALKVLIKAVFRICKIFNMDKKARYSLFDQGINAKLKIQLDGDVDSQPNQVTLVIESLIAFVKFYRALYAFSGGDTTLINHWLNVNNKHFGVPPRELLGTFEGIERLNRYFDELRANKH